MDNWLKTSCICCAQNCGLEVITNGNEIVKVRPDKDNPRSQGYCCRKGLKIAFHQNNPERLTQPLKRVGDSFQTISWDDAIGEIASRLMDIVSRKGPRSFAYMGGGGQACHFEAAYGVRLLRALGSRYHYSPLAQELTGMFWVQGRVLGRQYLITIPDDRETEVLVAWGWNGWMSHQIPQARRVLKAICDDPHRLLVSIDPWKSETARRADIHLPIRPGTDALLARAMIAIILNEGWEQKQYIAAHTTGFDDIKPLFADFDAAAALKTCELDYEAVKEVCRLFATRKSSLHPDLGIFMNRHSTACSYLQAVLLAICGRIGARGGNVVPGYLMPLGAHSDERDPKTWRALETNFPAIMGTFPPNVMPEEILSSSESALAAVLVSGSNPLRSYADTSMYERAFEKLELLVTIEVALSETARMSHYVLPARSAYEKWDGTFFAWNYPEIFFQMRRPVAAPRGDPWEESQIMIALADRMGLLPDIPKALYDAAHGDRMAFGMALMQFAQSEPKAAQMLPFVLGKTLGKALGSANLAALWGILQTAPQGFRDQAARVGFPRDMSFGEHVFQAILDHPEGLWIGRVDEADPFAQVRTPDKKMNLFIPELQDWVKSIEPSKEEAALTLDPRYPLILMAGRHIDENANTIMRDPAWNADRSRVCTMTMHPKDAQQRGLQDKQLVRVVTEAGHIEIPVEITEFARPGHVTIPHGFGLVHGGKTFGANVNRLTKNTHRDSLAGTPLHRYVPCQVEAL
jgi:anaerobic selenocysteine-containing dehydrogenase